MKLALLLLSILALAFVVLVVAPMTGAATPSAPTGVAVSDIGSFSANVTWAQPSGGGITGDNVSVYAGSGCAGTPSLHTVPPSNYTVVTGLDAGSAYSVTVTASNATGVGTASQCLGFTTLTLAGGAGPPTTNDILGGTVIAALVAASLLIAVTVALWRDRR